MPPLLYANVPLGLLNHAGRRRLEPADLAFFQGALPLCSVVTTPSAPSAAADLALFQGELHLRIPS